MIPHIGPVRLEFILFASTLVGVALFHSKTMYVALTGLLSVLIFKWIYVVDFSLYTHIIGGGGHGHQGGEWRTLLNLLGLLFGFAILAKHFEESKVPDILPNYIPNGYWGSLTLLIIIMLMSSFLDNIAAAMIGGTIALIVYKGKVHIGFLASIIAASNAGGAPSVLGDTTTTLMWIDGISPLDVFHAIWGSLGSFVVFGLIGAYQQHNYQAIQSDAPPGIRVDFGKLAIVAFILLLAIATNYALDFPALGVWVAILLGAFFRSTPWSELKHAWQGTIFLISLVLCASLMPVEQLPSASWPVTLGLGFVSAVFDNIPLTKLCLVQGGYDWGVLAYAVGFGGSMIWFGSSAGVALSNKFPEAKSVFRFIRHGWHVALAYTIGFFLILLISGWQPHAPHKKIATEVTSQHFQ
ncbi:MAG: citrate transporter [Oligoflexia bacterium]|nr:citrate transporter [Oligoflexia bacterium]